VTDRQTDSCDDQDALKAVAAFARKNYGLLTATNSSEFRTKLGRKVGA